jgi:hypothetical protein
MASLMSAYGTKQTLLPCGATSAFGGKVDIAYRPRFTGRGVVRRGGNESVSLLWIKEMNERYNGVAHAVVQN